MLIFFTSLCFLNFTPITAVTNRTFLIEFLTKNDVLKYQ